MSWMKRHGSAAPQRPEPQAYAAPQPYGNQQNMFPTYQGLPPGQQQQSWQVSQQQQQLQQHNQQYGQVYQPQQPFMNNTGQYFQQPQQQYNENYVNQNFDNVQQGYTQDYSHNQPSQPQNFTRNEGNVDGWEDNWGWGWEDSAKHYQNSMSQGAEQPTGQPQLYNNANVIEESFAPTNSWNWSMEDKKELEPPFQPSQNNQDKANAENMINENNSVSEPANLSSGDVMPLQENPEEVKSLNDKELVKEQLPNLALGKRFNLENLTPQWSIESQMSQDSSDGPHTHSEGTYRSENQSRNSSKSSPGPNTDATNFTYSQSGLNDVSLNSEWPKHSNDDSNRSSSIQNNNGGENYDEFVNSVQEMSIGNHENIHTVQHPTQNVENVIENIEPVNYDPSVSPASATQNQLIYQPMAPPPPMSAHNVQNPQATNSSLGSAVPSQTLPPNTPSPSLPTSASLPPPPSSVPLLPPTNFPQASNHNPFKSGAPFSHKNIAKAPAQPQAFVSQVPGASLTSPSVVNKVVHQDRLSASFGANLETTPDNSERPDQPQVPSFRNMSIPSQVPDNLEIAPQNDRNEYLQTEHLSSSDYGENTDFSRTIPPPGLRRMGVGQQEVEYNQNLNISGDEPPPGLARMVLGQQTETDNSYNQVVNDDYMDRQIDGQPTDGSGRPYRQAEGQQVADNYAPSVSNRGGERRPVGLDRMVPGEPSNDEYPQYQPSNFVPTNEHRVVTGVDHDYPLSGDAGRSDIREQNVDGSDYTEPPPRNPSRSVIGAREVSNATTPDFSVSLDDQQREITMEGENLQDLSIITYDGSNTSVMETSKERNHDAADVAEYPSNGSRRQSLNRVTSGEDSERDRAFKSSPRNDRDKQKSRERDRDRDRDKDRGRYSRGDRKYDREAERRSVREERREREGSPDGRRHRRSTRSRRYETEDTDYYSDRERDRDRRQHREGSYTSSKPPRGEDRDRRYDERERRRYNTIERERRYEEERGRRSDRHRDRDRNLDRDRDRNHDRFDKRYRDIDPRKLVSHRRDRDDDRRKGETYSSGSRAASREATATDEDGEEPRRRRDERRRHRHHHYYEAGYSAAGAGGAWDDALQAQRRQYEYYERLRLADPAAYARLYKQLLQPGLYGSIYDGYSPMAYEARAEERASVHSGRSSANGLKPTDTYYGRSRDAASLRTDGSDRELTTDVSLNLHLDASTVRSDRMTPFKYSTAHVKGVLCARSLLVVPAAYPADGRAAPLRLLALAALTPQAERAALNLYPGPLVKGVTHKKSVIDYCEARAAEGGGGGDGCGWALLWRLLALLLRQNGVVMGSDIAELLMKNTKEFEYKVPSPKTSEYKGSVVSGEDEDAEEPPPADDTGTQEEETKKPVVDEKEALERFRELLIYGNRQEALECAMGAGLWGHALQLAAGLGRAARAAAGARFLAALAPADPLHTLYCALALRAPPAATGVAEQRWGDWRPHAAVLLANTSAKPDHDRRTLTQFGDSLNARGLLYSAQFCYVAAGVPFTAHPLAPHRPRVADPAHAHAQSPPRLALLLANSRASTLATFATNTAIFATEIYEYALSLSQDYVLDELTVYKLVLGARLADAGQCERALRYAEAAARALTRRAAYYAPALAHALAAFADRLKYYDPSLQEEGEGGEGGEGGGEEGAGGSDASPRHHQWLRDLQAVASQLSAEASQQNTPQHQADPYAASWADQTIQQPQQVQQYPEPVEDTTDYSQYYNQQQQYLQQQQYQQQDHHQEQQSMQPQLEPDRPYEQYDHQYPAYDEQPTSSYNDSYWQGDTHYGYDGGAEGAAPTITMPGAGRPAAHSADDAPHPPPSPDRASNERETDDGNKKGSAKGLEKEKKSGWLGGILNKLTLRAPNQMILPDDTNPTIVWDEENKRWRDTAAGEVAAAAAAAAAAPPPPPPVLSTSTPLQSPGAGAVGAPGAPPLAPVSNIFKMQKSRHIKKSYVDVLNPSGARVDAAAPAPPAPLAPAPLAPAPLAPAPLAPPDSYFIPAPPPDLRIQVSIPSSPEASPAPSAPPTPHQGGIYDPTQMDAAGGDFRSGI